MTSNHQPEQQEQQVSAEDQHALSTGQPVAGVDLRAVRRRIVELVGIMDAEPFTRILDSAERMLREVESLRQQLAAVQAERDEALAIVERQTAVELRILDQHRALLGQIEELRQRASDYEIAEGTAVAQRNAALNEALGYKADRDDLAKYLSQVRAQCEALRGVVALYADQHNWFQTTHVQSGDFPTRVWAWEDSRLPWTMALAALDAASAGQPPTSTESHHPAPSANDSQRSLHTDTQKQDRADGPPGRHSAEAPGE